MLNRIDQEIEKMQMRQAYEAQQEHLKQSRSANVMHAASACRELTVGEMIDERIRKAERTLKSLHDIKGNLPQNFLNSSASRLGVFLWD